MKWRTHQACGVGMALILHLSPLVIGAACLGSILPDLFDQRVSALFGVTKKRRQKNFAAIHRGLSHWFGIWLLVLGLAYSEAIHPLARELAFGLGMGGFFHVILDMLTPKGVPVFPFFSQKVAIPLCSTGSVREYIFLAFLCLFFCYCWYLDLPSILPGVFSVFPSGLSARFSF